MMYHTDRFVDIEKSLHPLDKSHLIMVYDLFNVLLNSDCLVWNIFLCLLILPNRLCLFLCIRFVSYIP